MFRQTLSAKLASYIIIASLLLATVSSIISIYTDYSDFKVSIYQSINELLESTKSTASEAIFKLDTRIAHTLVDGIVANKYIIKSTLYDENNVVLASQEEQSPEDVWRPFNLTNETISIDIVIAGQTKMGRHAIVVDMERNLTLFYDRVINTVFAKFIEIIIIAFLVYLISVKLIARPVEALSRTVGSILPGEKAPDINLTKRQDEIGLLAQNTVNFIDESYLYSQQLETKQKERLVLEEKLRQSQKMEAIGQLAGGIAHDFNNIMTIILGNVSLTKSFLEPFQKTKIDRSLNTIKVSAERAAKLTKQLLIFSRKDLITPRLVDIKFAIESASKMVSQLVPETFHIDYKLNDVEPVYTDQSQIELILINLVVNAKDALAETGRIIIQCSNITINEDFVKKNPKACVGNYVLLSVSDTGSGITEDSLARIFEPFYTTKEVGKGTGLGLSTVYSIVDNWDGFILVQSEVNEGSTFYVYLPHSEIKSIPEKVVTETKNITHERLSATVLICEDDESVRELAVALLAESGLTIHQAADPISAIKLCKDINGQFDLLITDVIMPDMNGRELSETLSESYQFTTIFISGYSANVIADKGIIGHDVRFIQKPFTRTQLLESITEALNET